MNSFFEKEKKEGLIADNRAENPSIDLAEIQNRIDTTNDEANDRAVIERTKALEEVDALEKETGINMDETQSAIANQIRALKEAGARFHAKAKNIFGFRKKDAEVSPGKDTYARHIEALRERAINGDREFYSILVRRKNGFVAIIDEGEATSVDIPSDRIERLLKDDGSSLEIFHTHPLSAFEHASFGGFSAERLQAIRDRKEPFPKMIPSFIDVISSAAELKKSNVAQSRLKSRVVDPSGVWSYSFDMTSPNFDKMVALSKFMSGEWYSDAYDMAKKVGLSEREADELKRLLRDTGDHLDMKEIPFQERLNYIKDNFPEHKQLLDKLERKTSEYSMKKIQSIMADSGDFPSFGPDTGYQVKEELSFEDLMKFMAGGIDDFSDPKKMRQMTDYFERRGIHVKYEPFEEDKANFEQSAEDLDLGSIIRAMEKENSKKGSNAEEASDRAEQIRDELINHVGSVEYLERLKSEYGGNGPGAERERERRVMMLVNVKIHVVDQEEMRRIYEESGSKWKNGTLGFSTGSDIYVLPEDIYSGMLVATHELLHASTKNLEYISQKAKKILTDSYRELGDGQDRYFGNPTERLARKQKLDLELEQRGVKKYGEGFTDDHFNQMMELYQEGRLSPDSNDFILRTDPRYFKQIMNEVAANEPEKIDKAA